MVEINQKERDIITNLQAQEKMCIDKYERNAQTAKDPELKSLFKDLQQNEQKHYNMLSQILNGTVPTMQLESPEAYSPIATYVGNYNEADKTDDAFLCTDSITTEKYVSTAYNFNLFQFANSDIRKLLNDIETEEQNHAEKIYKYKSINQMA